MTVLAGVVMGFLSLPRMMDDPMAQQAYLKASNAESGDFFGGAVAVCGDTVVVAAGQEATGAAGVGGDRDDNDAPVAGAVYVFVRSGDPTATWRQQAYFKESKTAACQHLRVPAVHCGLAACLARRNGAVVGPWCASRLRGSRNTEPMPLRVWSAALVLAWNFTMSGCSSPPPAPQPPPLEGTSWVLTALPGRALVGEEKVTAQFADGRVFGSDGCNRYSAPVFIEERSIIVGPRGPSTVMACPPDVMQQADAFIAAMLGAMTYRVNDERLELLGVDGAVVASFAAQSTSLAGTTWEVVAINNGRGAVTGLVEDASVTLSFAADGTVSGSGGCNQYTATWTQEGTSMQFSRPASTRRMCPGEGVMEQEQAFFAALQSVSTMRFEGDRLEMRTADDALALMMRRSGK